MKSTTKMHVRQNASSIHVKTFGLLIKQFEHFTIEQEYPITVQTEYNGKRTLYIDLYIPQLKIAIECHGEQHFKPVKHFGGIEGFKNQKKNDAMKEKWCKDNQVALAIIRFDDKITSSLLKKRILKATKEVMS